MSAVPAASGAASAPAARAVTTLLIGMAALGVALLAPILFSDPNGVDPHQVRVAATALILAVVAWRTARLRPALPVLIGLAAFTVPYALWGVSLQLLGILNDALARARLPLMGGTFEFFVAILVEVAATVLFCVIAARVVPPALRARLRLRLSWLAVIASVVGILLLVVGGLAIPAQWLGRVAIQPVALARGFVWLVPADLLQGAVQELQFRGLLMGSLERVMRPWQANALQAVVFGLAHLALVYQGPVAPFVPITMALGFVFGWLTQRFRSLWPVMVVHGVADLLVDVAIVPGLYGL